ncbi:MAG: hypothetical protein EBZ53_08785, partial [Verrucomicrobia bacterium]|nr:hypothetical protein [Verrucomicrobiota bacterium]
MSDADQTVSYKVTFSEAVQALAAADLDIKGGTLDADSVALAADKLSASFQVKAAEESTADLVVGLKDTVLDVAGNKLVVPTANTLTVDTKNPAVATIDITYTLVFSEAVTGFTADDITVANGVRGTFTAVSATNYTLVVTPTANFEGNVTLDVAAGTATDLAGNPNTVATQSVQAVDTKNPAVVLATLSDVLISDADVGTGKAKATIVFSEAMDQSAAPTVTSSVATTLTNGTGAWKDATTYEVSYDVADVGVEAGAVTFDVSAAKDVAGNTQVLAQAVSSVAKVDTKNPAVEISDDESGTGNIAGGDITYTLVFSEAVTGFTADDITVANGVRGTFTAV